MKNNNNIDAKIKSYESLMHRVLQNYDVKMDYEDLMQEMRIVVWKALTDTSKRQYIENRNTKFTTYLYRLMENRLKNIFKIEYKIRPEDKNKHDKSIKIRSKRSLARPELFEDMSFEQQVNTLQSMHDADSIRLKSDLDMFFSILTTFEKKLWIWKIEGWNHYEITKKLKEENINKNRSTISRKLKIINDKFLKFIENGEL